MSAGKRTVATLAGMHAIGGAALAVTAFATTVAWNHPPTLHGCMHGIAAQTAFLCTASAMLLQAWPLHGDMRWRQRFRPAFAYAALCFALLWMQAFASWRAMPRGFSQKALILRMLGWLAGAAWQLLRALPHNETNA